MKSVSIVRIYIKEGDKYQGRNLMEEIFSFLHDTHKVHGVTVFRGVAGFGTKGEVHSGDLLRIAVHLPLVIEFYDDVVAVDAVLPRLMEMVPPAHIVRWHGECCCED